MAFYLFIALLFPQQELQSEYYTIYSTYLIVTENDTLAINGIAYTEDKALYEIKCNELNNNEICSVYEIEKNEMDLMKIGDCLYFFYSSPTHFVVFSDTDGRVNFVYSYLSSLDMQFQDYYLFDINENGVEEIVLIWYSLESLWIKLFEYKDSCSMSERLSLYKRNPIFYDREPRFTDNSMFLQYFTDPPSSTLVYYNDALDKYELEEGYKALIYNNMKQQLIEGWGDQIKFIKENKDSIYVKPAKNQ